VNQCGTGLDRGYLMRYSILFYTPRTLQNYNQSTIFLVTFVVQDQDAHQLINEHLAIARRTLMNSMLFKLYVMLQNLVNREDGQDLVEYALIVALIAFGCTAGMQSLAAGINTAFVNIATVVGNYTV
jgi:pilus assembly protein Flp/PilA